MTAKRVLKTVTFLLIFGIGFLTLHSCVDKKTKKDATEKVIKTEKSGDSKCGEGKCGGDKKEAKEKASNSSEGKCGDGKKVKDSTNKCGGDKKDDKCGTGKCGE